MGRKFAENKRSSWLWELNLDGTLALPLNTKELFLSEDF